MTTPHYTDEAVTVYHGDCVDVLRELPDSSVDAVVTDPPYGISFMGREWDQPGRHGSTHSKPVERPLTAGPVGVDHLTTTERSASMHAGKYDLSRPALVSFQEWCAEWAAECLRILRPGGHLVAFGGSRTWHRLAAGIEDAGFEIRDSIAWLYGSGFPKSRDVSDAMRRWEAGERPPMTVRAIPPAVYQVTAYLRAARDRAGWTNTEIDALFGTNGMAGHWVSRSSQPAVPSLRQWHVLKDELGFGDHVDDLVRELASTERPDMPREGPETRFLGTLSKGEPYDAHGAWGTALKPSFEPIVVGRRPVAGSIYANVTQYGTGALNIDGCRVPMSEEDRETFKRGDQAWRDRSERLGELRADGSVRRATSIYGEYGTAVSVPHDAGRWPPNVILDDDQADALGDPSKLFPIFRYEAKAPTHERPKDGELAHPTVKPYDLMRWLVRLVTPPGGVVLEPFAGSGTTCEAAVAEGMRCVAIEREADYLPLIVQRLQRPIQLDFTFGEL